MIFFLVSTILSLVVLPLLATGPRAREGETDLCRLLWGLKTTGTEAALPTLPLPAHDTARRAGNYVLLRCAPDAYVLLAHQKRQGVTVRPSDSVSTGTRLGEVGSGWEPHLHVSAQASMDASAILDAPRPFTFSGRSPVQNDVMWGNGN